MQEKLINWIGWTGFIVCVGAKPKNEGALTLSVAFAFHYNPFNIRMLSKYLLIISMFGLIGDLVAISLVKG